MVLAGASGHGAGGKEAEAASGDGRRGERRAEMNKSGAERRAEINRTVAQAAVHRAMYARNAMADLFGGGHPDHMDMLAMACGAGYNPDSEDEEGDVGGGDAAGATSNAALADSNARSCGRCLKVLQKPLVCARCKAATYCSKECQVY